MSDWPSVTRILADVGLGPDFSMIPRDTLEKARARGEAVHRLIESHHYQYLDEAEITPELAPYFSAYLKFLAESGHEPMASEFRVESTHWGFCGHPDRLGWLVGKRCLLDWKCVTALEIEPVARQLAGYTIGYEEQHPGQRIEIAAAVQLQGDGKYRFHEVDIRSESESEFLAAVVIYRRKRR